MEKTTPMWRRNAAELPSHTQSTLVEYAIGLLARRDYSEAELYDRLGRRTEDNQLIKEAINHLQQHGLQSNARFAEVFARSRLARRHGPYRILNDLRSKGISSVLAQEALQALDVDWCELACSALAARFSSPGQDTRERAKRQRFLAGRGFDGEQIRHALSCAWMSESDNWNQMNRHP